MCVSVGAMSHRALERLLPGVEPLVGLELAGLYEGSGAVGVVTEVGPLPSVGPQVSLQGLLARKVSETERINVSRSSQCRHVFGKGIV